MNSFQWNTRGVDMPSRLNVDAVERWLVDVARAHGKLVGDVNYTFCDDSCILDVNREFLDHDYYTDIITFDRSTRGLIKGDIFISLQTVGSNALELGEPSETELLRVIAHGVLHLCGIDDKGPGQREVMEREENRALALYTQQEYDL